MVPSVPLFISTIPLSTLYLSRSGHFHGRVELLHHEAADGRAGVLSRPQLPPPGHQVLQHTDEQQGTGSL